MPNITGQTGIDDNSQWYNGAARGAFINMGNTGYENGSGGESDGIFLGFDASRSNPIYGNSNTVQPSAYTVYYIMKIKK